ncbi:MAG: alpha/beta fold hydrolase [Leptospirales bacterium]
MKNSQTEISKIASKINKDLYPFESNYFETEFGKIHYVDEGKGQPIVMVHGNPTWSFLYRHFINGLSDKYRCIAIDHLGFGLSDKPNDFDYLPSSHAANLEKLITHLKLKNIVFVVQDWGGPIGLSYALNFPKNVNKLVIMNTFLWSVRGDKHYEFFSSFVGGSFVRFLILRFNFFANVIMKAAYGNKKLLTKEIHRHYKFPLANSVDRMASGVFPREIIGSSDWLAALWEKRENIKDKPALILWGMKDIAFREKELDTWQSLFTNSKTTQFPDAGHYLQEESYEAILIEMGKFL